jgi:restriction endonuclease S subunit
VTLSDVGKLRSGRVDYIHETEEKISELGLANSSARLLPKGTVILSRTASVGFSAILGKPMATTQDFVNWICGDSLLPKYLLYCFRSMRQEFDRITDGSTHKTIYMPEVEQFRIPLPPIESQKTIVKHLDEETGRIDSLVNTIQDGIKQLKEYRAALISAAVTGQIDVREATEKPVKQQYS